MKSCSPVIVTSHLYEVMLTCHCDQSCSCYVPVPVICAVPLQTGQKDGGRDRHSSKQQQGTIVQSNYQCHINILCQMFIEMTFAPGGYEDNVSSDILAHNKVE